MSGITALISPIGLKVIQTFILDAFAWLDAKDTRAIARTLQQENMPRLRWLYPDEPGEKHNTIFRATKVKAMKWVLGGD